MDSYTIVRSQRKTISLHVLPDATVLVKAPLRVSDRAIEQFVMNNQDWIEKQLQHRQSQLPYTTKRYEEGESFLYLGNEVTLTFGNSATIEVKDTKLLFPRFLAFRVQQELQKWYRERAKEVITRRLEWYAEDMRTSYTGLTFSDTKSRWGSCSHDNQLQFNWRLIMSPLLVINYVVVHELAHTVQKNHSQRFWAIVSHYNPSYRQQRLWLKKYGDILVI